MGHRLMAELLGKSAGTELAGWGQSPIEAVHCGMVCETEKTSVPCCLFIWEQGDIPWPLMENFSFAIRVSASQE